MDFFRFDVEIFLFELFCIWRECSVFFLKAYVKHATSTVFRMFVKILVALALLLKQYIKISLLPNFKTIMYW